MTRLEQKARMDLFHRIGTNDGFTGPREPFTQREFTTFAGVDAKRPGDAACADGIRETPAEAMAVHVEALKKWLAREMSRYTKPVVCVRAYPHVMPLDGGRFIAVSRLQVRESVHLPLTEDVEEKPLPRPSAASW